jgi:hypothetical protein
VKPGPLGSAFVPKRKNAIVRQLSDEFLVYDRASNQAHCLNQSAAEVWKLCDGKKNVAQIVRGMEKRSTLPVDEEVVWSALRQLQTSGLLLNVAPGLGQQKGLTRRALIRKWGSAAALTLPIVTSILVPTPAEAASCIPCGQACGGGMPCCPGCSCAVNLLCL